MTDPGNADQQAENTNNAEGNAGTDPGQSDAPKTQDYITASGRRLWTENGKTYSSTDRDGEREVDGDVYEQAVAIATLFDL
jgi:hypothetical protein